MQYFRKVGVGKRDWGAGITEVGGEICFTSVNFDSGKEELSADYGSSRRNLQYFRKVGAGRRGWGAEFTEVGREICFTSVNFGSGKVELSVDYGSGKRNLQYFRKVGAGRDSEELELRKWREKSVILP